MDPILLNFDVNTAGLDAAMNKVLELKDVEADLMKAMTRLKKIFRQHRHKE